MTLAERLRYARKLAQIKAVDAADRIGKKEATVRHHENGTRTPDTQNLAVYAKMYGVDFTWLATGQGKAPAESKVLETVEAAADPMELFRAYQRKRIPKNNE